MKIGGYQIVDFKNENFVVGTAKVIVGVHGTIESTRKPILLCGIQIANKEYHNAYVVPKLSGTSYVIDFLTYTITITDADSITIANA